MRSVTKKEALEACRGCMGIIEIARAKTGMSRKAFYNLRKRFPEVQEAIDDEVQRGLDFAETKLFELVRAGDFRAISYYLDRKGASRGWGERKDVNLTSNAPIQPIICFEPTKKTEDGG